MTKEDFRDSVHKCGLYQALETLDEGYYGAEDAELEYLLDTIFDNIDTLRDYLGLRDC